MPSTPIGSDLVPGLDDWKTSVERRLRLHLIALVGITIALTLTIISVLLVVIR